MISIGSPIALCGLIHRLTVIVSISGKSLKNVIHSLPYSFGMGSSQSSFFECVVVNNKYISATNGFKLCSLITVNTHMHSKSVLEEKRWLKKQKG